MCDSWLTTLKNAKKSCIQQNNLRKVHFELANGKELVEEYNMDTSVLTRRAWRFESELGAEGDWKVEIGDPEPTIGLTDSVLIKENSNQPNISRRVTKLYLEWRIRNLPYPIEVYSVTANSDTKSLTVRTTNKKYFKIIHIPEFERLNLVPHQINVGFSHKFNTLIITYKKPPEFLEVEKNIFEIVKKLKPRDAGEMDCKPS